MLQISTELLLLTAVNLHAKEGEYTGLQLTKQFVVTCSHNLTETQQDEKHCLVLIQLSNRADGQRCKSRIDSTNNIQQPCTSRERLTFNGIDSEDATGGTVVCGASVSRSVATAANLLM